jgi:alpha-methylacyl-CoA racemase
MAAFLRADMAAKSRSGPLNSVRILEFAGIGPGPFAGMLLGDLGADVVRIDRPGAPVPEVGDIVGRSRSAAVQLDLKSEAGRKQALALAARADAIIEGFRPGVMERLGLGPDTLHAANPRLVYGRMTGWGQTGPLAHTAGHDINYISLPGALGSMGLPGQPPAPPLNLVGDYGGGSLYLVVGLLSAILEARESGQGQVVDAAMVDGSASLMAQFFALRALGRWTDARQDNLLDGGAPFYGTYACRDGRYVSVGPIEPQFYALLREQLQLTDPIFDRQNDKAAWPEQRSRLGQVFATRTRDEWAALFADGDACVAPVLTLAEAPRHHHLAARQTFVMRDGVVQPAPAPRFSRTPAAIQRSPALEPTAPDEQLSRWSRR